MLIENCLQQISASRADRKAPSCLLKANILQPQISSFLIVAQTNYLYGQWLQELQGFAPKAISRKLTHAVYYVGVVVLAALLESLNELCVRRSWRQVCLYLWRMQSRSLSSPGRRHFIWLPKRWFWSGPFWARLETKKMAAMGLWGDKNVGIFFLFWWNYGVTGTWNILARKALGTESILSCSRGPIQDSVPSGLVFPWLRWIREVSAGHS